jgi:hypothetical protein
MQKLKEREGNLWMDGKGESRQLLGRADGQTEDAREEEEAVGGNTRREQAE